MLPFHPVCLTFVSPSFSHARHIDMIDVHRCLSCLHGLALRSPGSWLGGSRVSALRLFCLAPVGPSGDVFGCFLLLLQWRACSVRGTQAAWSLRFSPVVHDASFHCFLFWSLCFCCGLFLVCLLFAVVFCFWFLFCVVFCVLFCFALAGFPVE